MIQLQTKLKVSDNSGAKIVKCIKTLGGFKKKSNTLGDIVLVSVLQLRNKAKITSKVRKGELYKAVLIRSKKKSQKFDGSTCKFNENSVFLLNKQGKPIATRIIGPVTKNLKNSNFSKFLNLATGIA